MGQTASAGVKLTAGMSTGTAEVNKSTDAAVLREGDKEHHILLSADTAPLPVFRLCEEEDLPVIMELDREAFFDFWSREKWLRELQNTMAIWIVEELGREIVGYAGIWLVTGEAQVMRVAVRKTLRNRGLGLALTKILIQKAWDAGAEAITLEARESNRAALAVYERCGFISSGVRPDYYEDNHEGAVIMWLYRNP